MESPMVPDTVQLIVEVAGLWSSAPALDTMRPAGMAPFCKAHRKRVLFKLKWDLLLVSPKHLKGTIEFTTPPTLWIKLLKIPPTNSACKE